MRELNLRWEIIGCLADRVEGSVCRQKGAGEQLHPGQGPRGGVQARHQTLILGGLHPITVP